MFFCLLLLMSTQPNDESVINGCCQHDKASGFAQLRCRSQCNFGLHWCPGTFFPPPCVPAAAKPCSSQLNPCILLVLPAVKLCVAGAPRQELVLSHPRVQLQLVLVATSMLSNQPTTVALCLQVPPGKKPYFLIPVFQLPQGLAVNQPPLITSCALLCLLILMFAGAPRQEVVLSHPCVQLQVVLVATIMLSNQPATVVLCMQVPPGKKPLFLIPVFNYHQGSFCQSTTTDHFVCPALPAPCYVCRCPPARSPISSSPCSTTTRASCQSTTATTTSCSASATQRCLVSHPHSMRPWRWVLRLLRVQGF
jgi:hypothetical protein